MNEIKYKLIIISSSEIVLRGLSGLLSQVTSIDIITARSAEELNDYPLLAGYIVVISEGHNTENFYGSVREKLKSAKEIRFVELRVENNSGNDNHVISIFDKPEVIIEKVNRPITSFKETRKPDKAEELTTRETEVLKLISKGHSNKEIADKLFISTHTVITHRKNITEKTGIRSASGLAMYGVINRIIDINEIDTDELV